GFGKSKGEMRRAVLQKSIRINDQLVLDPFTMLQATDLQPPSTDIKEIHSSVSGVIKLSLGKKRYGLVISV
ncbi:MAG: hypothetical protein AAF403_06400, partial [Pseudomonadota bacterium]